MKTNFYFTSTPQIVFGPGKIQLLTEYIKQFGHTALIFTGSIWFKQSEKYDALIRSLDQNNLNHYHDQVSGEPSPQFVNRVVEDMKDKSIDVVVAIGGGSVIDAGKAVSAMLGKNEDVENYLEGIGTKTHDGTKIAFIAIPTTAGTGSEATKNAVLSKIGKSGFKKSMRHDNFVPDIALIDPELTISCPPEVTAACGMDAFTQLLESYVSVSASPITDVLAYQGISNLKDKLLLASTTGAQDIEVRAGMSFASLLSGITLANAGLGIVHGLASPIGSYFKIPHGVICGSLIGAATSINIELMREKRDENLLGLKKYADIGQLFSGNKCKNMDQCCDYLINSIEQWIDALEIPKLGIYGVSEEDIDKIVRNSGNKYNPINLGQEEIARIVRERL